jgi:hypothetical protein
MDLPAVALAKAGFRDLSLDLIGIKFSRVHVLRIINGFQVGAPRVRSFFVGFRFSMDMVSLRISSFSGHLVFLFARPTGHPGGLSDVKIRQWTGGLQISATLFV